VNSSAVSSRWVFPGFKSAPPLMLASLIVGALSSCGILRSNVNTPLQQHTQAQIAPQLIQRSEVTVQNEPRFGITMLKIRGPLDFLFSQRGFRSLKSAARAGAYRYLVNGSYFDVSVQGFQHAGWLSIQEVKYSPVKADQQLTCLVRYDLKADTLAYASLSAVQPVSSSDCILFQTGPLVIDQGRIDSVSIKRSINGSSLHLRTLLGSDSAGYKYLLITREPVTLYDLVNYLLELDLFKTQSVSFVNLDGGSSTALYAREQPGLDFNASARLPILLGVR